MVTMVDAHNFLRDLKSIESLRDRGQASSEQGTINLTFNETKIFEKLPTY